MYEAATAEKFELATWVDSLNNAGDLVELDGYYTLLDVYTEKIDGMTVGEELGEYTENQKKQAESYWEDASTSLVCMNTRSYSP